MKDYSKEIEDIIPTSTDLASPTIIRGFLKQLEVIIRKDVEAEEVKSRLLDLNRQREIFDLRNEIERLKEENESLKSENIRFKKSLMQLQLQANEAPLLVGKPDSERLWEAMLKLSTPLMYKGEVYFTDKKLVKETAMDMLAAWKEAKK